MKSIKLQKKTSLIALVVVMMINAFLVVFLLQNALAQTSEDKLKDQPKVRVNLLSQYNSPIRITITNIDNFQLLSQEVNYTVQNLSGKKIRGYVISGNTKDTGKIITGFFSAKPFEPLTTYSEQLRIERENLKTDSNLLISIDYVLFDDGSSWGDDSLKQAEVMEGNIRGAKAAVENLKFLIQSGKKSQIEFLSSKKLTDIEVQLPEGYRNKSEKWQRAFQSGYRSIFIFLKNDRSKDNEYLLEKLIEIENTYQSEREETK